MSTGQGSARLTGGEKDMEMLKGGIVRSFDLESEGHGEGLMIGAWWRTYDLKGINVGFSKLE